MKICLLVALLSVSAICYGQESSKITTIEFVQVLNENTKEAVFYFQNNWKVLRATAQAKGYIHSFQLLETTPSEAAPFNLMLITTYPNKEQYDLREAHFTELIEAKGPLKLLNDKEPGVFRKSLFSTTSSRHLH